MIRTWSVRKKYLLLSIGSVVLKLPMQDEVGLVVD